MVMLQGYPLFLDLTIIRNCICLHRRTKIRRSVLLSENDVECTPFEIFFKLKKLCIAKSDNRVLISRAFESSCY